MEFIAFLISVAIFAGLCVAIANWGKAVGLRWGQVWLFGIALSPVIAAVIVLIYSISRKFRLSFLK